MIVLILLTLIIYLLIIVAMRLMGKRQLGELQPSELVSTILISNLASISIESQELPLFASILPVFLIVALELILSAVCLYFPKMARLISGTPVMVIRDGVIDQKTLRALRFSMADLLEALRSKDVFDPKEVSYALIETNGGISVCKMRCKEPLTKEDVKIPCDESEKPTIPFVLDGRVLERNLKWCGKDPVWIEKVVQKEKTNLNEILLLMGDNTEEYWMIKKENDS